MLELKLIQVSKQGPKTLNIYLKQKCDETCTDTTHSSFLVFISFNLILFYFCYE